MEEQVCVFDDVHPESSAYSFAEKDKVQAFGMLARMKVWDRPKDADIVLHSTEKRYEPFWHIKAVRTTRYDKKVDYAVPLGNPHIQSVTLLGQECIPDSRHALKLSGVEHCRVVLTLSEYFDGMSRDTAPGALADYVSRFVHDKVQANNEPRFIVPTVTASFLMQEMKSRLMKPLAADEIHEDVLEVESITLYYRPIYAFDFVWKDKHGVIEIDGLNGRVNREGRMLSSMMRTLGSRDTLFDLGVEIASTIVPGGGVLLRMVDKLAK
jgi:hypothetical protein